MPKKIVLVRHGKAERRSSLVPDRQRSLTTQGLEAIERTYPTYFAGLTEEGDVCVLASSAVRTMQTARVVCRAMGLPEDSIVTLNSLTKQEVDGTVEEILSRDGVVVAVGHSPSIDQVASRLSGRMRMMLRGEALCLDAEGRRQGMPVLWDCQAK